MIFLGDFYTGFRDVDNYGETYSTLSVKWHILPNTLIPEGISDVGNAKQDKDNLVSLSKILKHAYL